MWHDVAQATPVAPPVPLGGPSCWFCLSWTQASLSCHTEGTSLGSGPCGLGACAAEGKEVPLSCWGWLCGAAWEPGCQNQAAIKCYGLSCTQASPSEATWEGSGRQVSSRVLLGMVDKGVVGSGCMLVCLRHGQLCLALD